MLSERSRENRAQRYRLEAAYLRGVIGTIRDPGERLNLAQIAAAYERLADRITAHPEATADR